MISPSFTRDVASLAPTITGMPRLIPTTAAWLVKPPSSTTTAALFSNAGRISLSVVLTIKIPPSSAFSSASALDLATIALPITDLLPIPWPLTTFSPIN